MMNRTEDVLVMIAKLRIRSKLNTRCADVPMRYTGNATKAANNKRTYVPYVGTFDLSEEESSPQHRSVKHQ